MTKTIRVNDDTHDALAGLKADDESFDDLLGRLIERRRELIREGAGFWEGTDAAEKAREAREATKEQIGR